MSEESTPQEESKPVEKKPDCIVIPEHMKPLFECCKEFDEGKIEESDFFARSLILTGKFMQDVKQKREAKPSE